MSRLISNVEGHERVLIRLLYILMSLASSIVNSWRIEAFWTVEISHALCASWIALGIMTRESPWELNYSIFWCYKVLTFRRCNQIPFSAVIWSTFSVFKNASWVPFFRIIMRLIMEFLISVEVNRRFVIVVVSCFFPKFWRKVGETYSLLSEASATYNSVPIRDRDCNVTAWNIIWLRLPILQCTLGVEK